MQVSNIRRYPAGTRRPKSRLAGVQARHFPHLPCFQSLAKPAPSWYTGPRAFPAVLNLTSFKSISCKPASKDEKFARVPKCSKMFHPSRRPLAAAGAPDPPRPQGAQETLIESIAAEAEPTAAAGKRSWPTPLSEQVRAVRAALAEQPGPGRLGDREIPAARPDESVLRARFGGPPAPVSQLPTRQVSAQPRTLDISNTINAARAPVAPQESPPSPRRS